MKLRNLKDLYVHELKDLYDAETRLVDALPKMAKKASSDELKQAFQSHLNETKKQSQRLEMIFEELGESPSGETCDAMKGLIKEGEDILKAEGDETTLDAALIAAANRVEHYEMAGYGAARAHASLLGLRNQADMLQQTLDEEGAADHKLMEIAKRLNPRSVARA